MEFRVYSPCICFVVTLLMQMLLSISAKFMVHGTVEPSIVTWGGQVEFHCHISPPQSAAHMEIRWFRDRYTQPVHLYQDGKDVYGETIKEYVERTEFLKKYIGEGNVTLRIQNIVAYDVGMYHCLFKDGDFFEEAVMELQVAALGLEIQFQVNITYNNKITLECKSGGWFPKPHIQLIDNNGQIISSLSEFYLQDVSKLFNISTNVTLTDNHKGSVTCYLQNPITGQEKWTTIKLPGTLISIDTWTRVTSIIFSVPLLIRFGYFFYHQLRNPGHHLPTRKICPNSKTFDSKSHIPIRKIQGIDYIPEAVLKEVHSGMKKRAALCVVLVLMIIYVLVNILQYIILYTTIKDPVLSYNVISMDHQLQAHAVVMLFFTMLIYLFYFLLRATKDQFPRNGEARESAQDLPNRLSVWLGLPSQLDFEVFSRAFTAKRLRNQDHANEVIDLDN